MLPKSSIETKLDAEINTLLDKLVKTEKDSDDYDALVERISKLYKLKSEETTKIQLPSMDSVLFVSANIFGILWLTRFEKENVIKAPKAFGFILKPR
jgi:hypothetical protein